MSTSQLVVLVMAVVIALLVLAVVLAVAKRRPSTSVPDDPSEVQTTGLAGPAVPDRVPADPVSSVRTSPVVEPPAADRVPPPPVAQPRPPVVEVRPLDDESRERYRTAWQGVETRFADSPVLALSEADALLSRLMSERGYPAPDDESPQVLPEPHQRVLDGFRAGHAIEQRNTTGNADTAQVGLGMTHFRQVFAVLVGDRPEPYPAGASRGSDAERH